MGISEGDVLISCNQSGSSGSVIQTIMLCAMGMANSSLEQHNSTM